MIATVFCLARDEVRAMRVLDELRAAGFSEDRISALLSEKAIAKGIEPRFSFGGVSKAPGPKDRDAAILHGLPHRTILSRPDVGWLMGAGPLMLGLDASTAENIGEAFRAELTGAGLPGTHAEFYQASLVEGKVVLSVKISSPDEAPRVQAVLKRAGAEDVIVCGESSQQA